MHSIRCRGTAGIYDRSPFSVILYKIIHDKTFDFNNLGLVFKQISDLKLIKTNEQFLIILPQPANFHLVLEHMKKRSNNIDILNIDYIQRQFHVFYEFSKFFGLPTFFVSHQDNEHIEQSIRLLYNNALYLYNSSLFMTTEISKPYSSDAGYDLTLKQDLLVTPYEKVKLIFNERIVIPVNYAGILCGRSSLNLYGCLRVGVIDATYNGELSAIFVADGEEVSLKQGQRIAQLVIFPIASKLPVTVTNVSQLPALQRGQNCFGSSGQF